MRICPACQETNAPNLPHCTRCGASLSSAATTAEPQRTDEQWIELAIRDYTSRGWRVATRGAGSVQFVQPKRASVLAGIVFLVLPFLGGVLFGQWMFVLIGLVAFIADYAIRKDRFISVSVDDAKRAYRTA